MKNYLEISSIDELNSELEKRVLAAEHLLNISRGIFKDEHKDEVASVNELVTECRRALNNPEPVSVALLGGTGAGKSTLVNAILGAVVLPTSSFSVCTSSITRVRYKSGQNYSATIEIVPAETWMKQVQAAADDVKASLDGELVDDGYTSISVIPDDEAARIRAIYGDEQYEQFATNGVTESLKLPAEIVEAFRLGKIELTYHNTEELRKGISKYLTSKEFFWPIVKSVIIEGPFEAFDHGGEIVDLPGLNDPNEAREDLTKKFLDTAKFVWVIFNMKRPLGKELTQVLESRDLLNRLLAGGRIQTLTFIGTHSDDVATIDPEQLGLEGDPTNSDIALKRNELAEDELRQNLRKVSRAIDFSGGGENVSRAISELLVKSPAFMVSASNFLQLEGASKSRVQVIFEDKYETNIPQLRAYMKRLCVEVGPKADAYTLVTSLEEIVADISALAKELYTENALTQSVGRAAQQSLAESVVAFGDELNSDIDKVMLKLRRSLQQAVERFDKGSALDKDAVTRVISRTTHQWSNMHWATLRATASRGGRFISPTRGQIDLIRQLSEPVIHHSITPWMDFFGKDLPALTSEASGSLQNVLVKYAEALSKFGNAKEEIGDILMNLLPDLASDFADSIESALAVAQKSVDVELTKRRQELHSMTDAAISSSMNAVFARAASERGEGMKSRMNRHLESGSKSAVSHACDLVQENLAKSVRKAVDAVLIELAPAAEKMNQKSMRLTKRLGELSIGQKTVSPDELRTLMKSVHSAKLVISKPMNFAVGYLASATPFAGMLKPADLDQKIQPKASAIFVDASNVARRPGAPPNVSILDSCRQALSVEFPGREVLLIADASLPTLVGRESSQTERDLFNRMIAEGKIVIVPPGTPGKADKFILSLASSNDGIVVSNDSFREFQNENQWLFTDGRLRGHAYGESIGWHFPVRFPVRARSDRYS